MVTAAETHGGYTDTFVFIQEREKRLFLVLRDFDLFCSAMSCVRATIGWKYVKCGREKLGETRSICKCNLKSRRSSGETDFKIIYI